MAAGTDRVFTMTAAVSLSALTVQNGVAADAGGGGIQSNSALTLTNVTVYSNTAQWGGGAYVEGASVYAASLVISGSQFLSNTASNGDGGGLRFVGRLTIADSRFEGNRNVVGDGGGVNSYGPLSLTNVEFANNSVEASTRSGGALYALSHDLSDIAAMTNVTVTGNSANGSGGGIYLDNVATISGGYFEANRCTGSSCQGGGLYLTGEIVNMAATQFISNEAGSLAGGLFAGKSITITQGLFERNVVRSVNGMGGGLSAGDTNRTVLLSDTHFISNTASSGGGVFLFGPAQLVGGEFAENMGDALHTIHDLTISPMMPFTYSGDFTLEKMLYATGDLTFTGGTVTFWNSTAVHYLTNTASTAFERLIVSAQAGTPVLDVGVSSVSVSDVFTNAGVIHRLAPTQTVTVVTLLFTPTASASPRQSAEGATPWARPVCVSAPTWPPPTSSATARLSLHRR